MLSILVLMYIFNFNGISTICIAICGIVNLYGTIMCNEQGIRIFGMIGSGSYTAFMLITGNIIGTICEVHRSDSDFKFKKRNKAIKR